MKEKEYDNRWHTTSVNLSTLIDNNAPYGFNINERTTVSTVVDNIVYNIESYSMPFWDENDDLIKFYENLVQKKYMTTIATMALNKPEWNLLALSILLDRDSSTRIIDEYALEFQKVGFTKDALLHKVENIEEGYLL